MARRDLKNARRRESPEGYPIARGRAWRSLQLENRGEKRQHSSVGGGGRRGIVGEMGPPLLQGSREADGAPSIDGNWPSNARSITAPRIATARPSDRPSAAIKASRFWTHGCSFARLEEAEKRSPRRRLPLLDHTEAIVASAGLAGAESALRGAIYCA
jgi:hypothetical protein